MVSERSAVQPGAEVLVASNRGPVSYALGAGGELTAKRGGGGLVSGLSAIGQSTRGAERLDEGRWSGDGRADAEWVCSALGDGDREAVRRTGGLLDVADTGGQRVRMLDIPADVHAAAYNGVANSVLWFVHHMLYQTPLEPVFDADFRGQWAAYEAYNAAFATALADAAGPGAAVLVQDYHLALVPGLLRGLRPDVRIAHFSHTPWAPPEYFAMLPDDVGRQLLLGILGADRANFLTERWARAFTACCARTLGPDYTTHWPRHEPPSVAVVPSDRAAHRTRIGVHGLGADAEFLRERSRRPDVEERMAALREQIGGQADGTARKTIVRGWC